MEQTQRRLQKRYWRRKDYRGRYTGSVVPASWQENMDALRSSLEAAQKSGDVERATFVQRVIDARAQLDPEQHDRSLGLRP